MSAALPADFELLAAAYLTADIDDAGMDQLERTLRDNRAARDCFAALTTQDIALRQALRATVEAHIPQSESVRLLLQRRPQQSHSRRKTLYWAVAAAAACVVIVMTWMWMQRTAQTPIARLNSVGTGVTVTRAGETKTTTASAGADLFSGDSVTTPKDTEAKLSFAGEATSIDLKFDTQVRIRQELQGKRIDLNHGTIACDVAKQPAGHSMVLSTNLADAEIIGTQFTLTAEPVATMLDVKVGQVKITRRADGQSAQVDSGRQIVVGAVSAMTVEPDEATLAAAGWRKLIGADLSNWNPVQGEWRIEHGELLGIAHGPTGYDFALIRTSQSLTDFELTCQARVEKNFYCEFQVRDNDWQFQNPVGGVDHDKWRDIHITAKGKVVTCTIDGQPAGIDSDLSKKQKLSGVVGFYVRSNGQVRIRNIRLRTMEANVPGLKPDF